jgi:acyl carrier protein
MTTVEQLKKLIHEKFDIALDAIDPEAPFASYELDSLTLAELMFAIDDEFHVVVPDDAVQTVTSLSGLADLLDSLLAKKAAG